MILIVPHYPSPDHARRGEIELCLRANLAHPGIDRVLLVGADRHPPHPKLTLVPGTDRPTFDALFRLADQWPGEVVIVANADIYFDATLALAAGIGHGELYALSRWNPITQRLCGSIIAEDGTERHSPGIGADAWIFRSPLPPIGANFAQGLPFCDHRAARLAQDAGLRASNPCLSIRTWHAHASRFRTYTPADCIPGPYAWLQPSALPEPPACRLISAGLQPSCSDPA
jgi:hypothetical protein